MGVEHGGREGGSRRIERGEREREREERRPKTQGGIMNAFCVKAAL